MSLTAGSVEISESHVRDYQRDGITVVRGAFPPAWIERMRRACDDALEHPTAAARIRSSGNERARFQHDRMLWRDNDEFRAFIFESPAAALAKAFLRANEINVYFDHVLVKEPGAEIPTPWHQDLPYWPIAGEQICSIWLALDPVSRANGGVAYVRGSHRGPVYRPIGFAPESTNQWQTAAYEPLPDIDGHPTSYDIVTYDLEPGDCTIHHAKTIHGAPGNGSDSVRRRGISTRWAGDDARYDPRPKTDAALLSERLHPGARIGGPDFPRVIPQ